MAIHSLPSIFVFVCAFLAASAITSEDALAAQKFQERAPPELQEVFQQLLQEPDFDEDGVGQFLQQLRKEHDFDEHEEVEEREETGEQEAKDKEAVKEEEETHEWNAKEEEVFGQHFGDPRAFVTDMQSQGIPPKEVQDIFTGVIDSVKDDFEIQTKEMTLELPHVGEVGAKNAEAYHGEPLIIQDTADASTATSLSQHTLLQMNRFLFNGNVLNRPKIAEDDVTHWIIQFCPHWWDPCVGLTNSFAKVGSKLEEQLNTALYQRSIHFATVDCASEKALCNEQDVQTYPTTRHYYKGEFVAGWFGGQAHHGEFYTQWLMQQAQGITPETPAGHLVGNLTNSTKGARGSKEKREKEEIAFPTFEETAMSFLLVAVLIALCTQAVLCNARLWQGATPQLQQQYLPHRSASSRPQELPKKAPHSEHCRQRSSSRMRGAEPHLPSSWNNQAKSMEL